MAHWITDIESKIFTLIKYSNEKEFKTEYPNIYHTTDSEISTETKFPTIYIHFLPNDERGQTLDSDTIDAYMCGLQIEVICSKSQGQALAKSVMYNTIDTLKKYGFSIFQMPEFMTTGNETKRIVARARRIITNDGL